MRFRMKISGIFTRRWLQSRKVMAKAYTAQTGVMKA